jgi:hypothetical protein
MGLAGLVTTGNTKEARRSGLEWFASSAVVVLSVLMLSQDLMLTHLTQVGWGADFVIVRDAASRWLDTGVFYLPEQLTGAYYWPGPWVLYPPTMLVLFVPFVFLPGVLWWAVPIGITVWAVWKHHPRPLAWAVIAFCIANPTTISMTIWGNPGLWFVAAVALGTHYPRFAPLVLLKPTLFPFALIGIWKREWWIGLVVLALVSLPFVGMLPDYLQAIDNAMGGWGNRWLYSISQVPAMLIPVVAWLGHTRNLGVEGVRIGEARREPDPRQLRTGVLDVDGGRG